MRFKDSLPNQNNATRLFNQVHETFIELTALEGGPLLLTTAQKAKLKIALPFVNEVISQPADVLLSTYQNNLECGILSLLCLIGVMVAPNCFPVIDIEPLCNEKKARRALVAFLMDLENLPRGEATVLEDKLVACLINPPPRESLEARLVLMENNILTHSGAVKSDKARAPGSITATTGQTGTVSTEGSMLDTQGCSMESGGKSAWKLVLGQNENTPVVLRHLLLEDMMSSFIVDDILLGVKDHLLDPSVVVLISQTFQPESLQDRAIFLLNSFPTTPPIAGPRDLKVFMAL
jgi:hypothetical protein